MERYRTPVYTVQASEYGLGPPREQTGPLGWGPDPSMWGPSRSQQGPGILGQSMPKPYTRLWRGSGADTCPGLIVCTSAPRPGGDPMLPRGLLHVT
jgi:hypothetical protein